MGIGGAVVLLILSLIFGRNFFSGGGAPSGSVSQEQPANAPPASETPEEHQASEFVVFVVNDVQSTWDRLLTEQGNAQYTHTKLVFFRDTTQSGCGFAQSASGPFYCPVDQKVYLDLAFFDELRRRFKAPGDFAQAYVIAHEVGHHVQKLLGIEPRVHEAMERDPDRANEYSVRLELQADCLAGVWGHSTQERRLLDPDDIDEGLAAASAVGDDRLQRSAGRAVNPESWTHGSARDRAAWFRRGFDSGRISDCDTFNR